MMKAGFHTLFVEHPRSVDETYGEHARFALGFSGKLFLAGCAALIHAVVPGLCKSTASSIVRDLAQQTSHRGRTPPDEG